MARAISVAGAFVAWISLAALSAAQSVASGDLLIATEKLGDPNFAETVVLITQHDEDDGTVGLILNRRTKIPLAKLFPDIKGAAPDPVFMGGPVSLTAAQAILKMAVAKPQATHVLNNIYATGNKDMIEDSVRSHTKSSEFRLYLGYAGWAPGQLEAEIRIGAWTVLSTRPALVFDPDPDSLWDRLTHQSHMQIAAVIVPATRALTVAVQPRAPQ